MLPLVATSFVLAASLSSSSCTYEEQNPYCSQKLAGPSCYTQQCPSMPVEDTMKRFDLIMKERVWGQQEVVVELRRKVRSHLQTKPDDQAPAVFHFVGRCRSGKTRMAESVGAALSSRKIGNKDCASVTIQGDHFIGMSMKEARTEMRDILRKQLLVTERSVFILNDMQKFAELPLIIEMVVMGTMFDTDAEVSLRRSIVIITSDFGKEGASDVMDDHGIEYDPLRWGKEKKRCKELARKEQIRFTDNHRLDGRAVLFPFGSALDEEHAYPELFAFLLKRDVLCKLPCTLTGSWGFRTCRKVTFSFEMDDLKAAMVKWRGSTFDGSVESLTVQGLQAYLSDLGDDVLDSLSDLTTQIKHAKLTITRKVGGAKEWDISVKSMHSTDVTEL